MPMPMAVPTPVQPFRNIAQRRTHASLSRDFFSTDANCVCTENIIYQFRNVSLLRHTVHVNIKTKKTAAKLVNAVITTKLTESQDTF